MTQLQYQLLSGAMRFVFVPLILFILWRCAKNAWIEYRFEKTHVGDVGADGEVMGYAALIDEWQDEDAWRPLYDDTVVGSAADCAVTVCARSMRACTSNVAELMSSVCAWTATCWRPTANPWWRRRSCTTALIFWQARRKCS